MAKKLIKIITTFVAIFLIENLLVEIWYRLSRHLPIWEKLPALPAHRPPMPTVFTSFFWADHNPDTMAILWALSAHVVLSIILTIAILFILHINKK